MSPKFRLLIEVPSSIEHGTLVTLCSLVGMVGQHLESSNTKETINQVLNDPQRLACVSIERLEGTGMSVAGLSWALLNERARRRVALIVTSGSMTASERAFVNQLGFGAVCADLAPEPSNRDLLVLIDWIASHLGEAVRPTDFKLRAYLKAVPRTDALESPRYRIQRITGMSPEACAQVLQQQLTIDDHRTLLKSYEDCFIAKQAAIELAKIFKLKLEQALVLGVALQRAGVIVPVADWTEFAMDDQLYRLNQSSRADKIQLKDALRVMMDPENHLIQDRQVRGKTVTRCFVADAVISKLVLHFAISRVDATRVMQRLHNLRCFSAVTGQSWFRDGPELYKFRG